MKADVKKLKYLDELDKLNLPKNHYVIVGSGPLVIRGIRESNSDIDLTVTKWLWNTLARKHTPFMKEVCGVTKPFLSFGNVEMSFSIGDMTGTQAVRRADVVSGYRFLSLRDTIRCKKMHGRDKDLEDIKNIKEYLRNNGK